MEILSRLDDDEIAAVTLLVERATEADGVRPLSEHVMLHLRDGGDEAGRNLLLYADGRGQQPHLAGYAHLDDTDLVDGASGELVVDPAWRGQGVGRTLANALVQESPDGRLRLWAHGEHDAAGRLAAALGFRTSRHLWQLRRSLFAPLPRPELPEGVTLRTFRAGLDDDAWLALNERAFSAHPEQGEWTLHDLQRRIAEPWFDPNGFFLAERSESEGARLVGFHWTKVHGGESTAPAPDDVHGHGHDPIGEVYIVGVDPSEQGHGLGRALTLVGLQHLRSQGLSAAMLYVDADNQAAIRLYEDLGFTRWDADVMYARDSPHR